MEIQSRTWNQYAPCAYLHAQSAYELQGCTAPGPRYRHDPEGNGRFNARDSMPDQQLLGLAASRGMAAIT